MKLSIVIVNYNVKYFLEQCLNSVLSASKDLDCEVFVVDNTSVDGSVAMLKDRFKWVKLIENAENVGFAKANNQAIRISSGEYVLLLNPDTVLEESTLKKTLAFMDNTPLAGGLGVKMINGKGKYLPESKRGFPTPATAFYKIFGLSSLFPRSQKFSKYHLGYLNKDEIHEVDVLSGAYMLMRQSVLNEVGLLDEAFFMYGEDVDLSYRIIKAGYKNIYYPETTIIHYKGESTKKGSLNYVMTFYNAMLIFIEKHFSGKTHRFFTFFIQLAIFLRASVSVIGRMSENIYLPILDILVVILGYRLLIPWWEFHHFNSKWTYPPEFQKYVVPAYTFVWVITIYFMKGYRQQIRVLNYLKGIGLGSILILTLYSLLSEKYRYSRVLILLGAVWLLAFGLVVRTALHFLRHNQFRIFELDTKRIVVVSEYSEIENILKNLKSNKLSSELIGYVDTGNSNSMQLSDLYLGNILKLEQIIRINRINEVLFCSQSLSAEKIIQTMHQLSRLDVEFKIISANGTIIGSNSILAL